MSMKNLLSIGNNQMDYFNTPNELSDIKISFKNETGKNSNLG